MTLRVFFEIYMAGPKGISRKELQEILGISKQAVLYHTKKLKNAGLIQMSPKMQRNPGTIYIATCHLGDGKKCLGDIDALKRLLEESGINVSLLRKILGFVSGFGGFGGLVFSVRGLAGVLGVGVRGARRLVNVFVSRGLVLPFGGVRCRYRVYVWVGGLRLLGLVFGFVHRHVGRVGHRFRSRHGFVDRVRRLVKEYCDFGYRWDWFVFRRFVLSRCDDPYVFRFFWP